MMIDHNIAEQVAIKLSEKFGISLISKYGKDEKGEYINILPTDIDPSNGFSILIRIGWRSIIVEFVPGTFSASLINSMGHSSSESRRLFRTLAENAMSHDMNIVIKINDKSIGFTDIIDAGNNWTNFHLSLRYQHVVIESIQKKELEDLIVHCSDTVLSLIVILLPIEAIDDMSEFISTGLPEGALMRIEVNKYERNPINRMVCIEINGSACKICGFDFSKVYGTIGYGFIHVHHIVPVSRMVVDYSVNPKTDLVPVCPNCHAMLHRQDPPYTIGELKKIIESMKF
jgi:5-methylcytosine-specific restriction protein A